MAKDQSVEFGAKLRELREGAGLTQVQLAEKAGLHSQAVVKLERGEREPAWSTLVALADALGVSCDTFRQKPGKAKPRSTGRPPKAAPSVPSVADLEAVRKSKKGGKK